MANDVNVVVLVGRLVRSCEFKTTPSGTAVCRFSIAVNRRKRNGDKWEDEVSYFDIVVWGRSAEALRPYLEKGRQVSIEGELRQNRWEQDGQARSRIEVVANNIQLLGGIGQGSGTPQQGSSARYESKPTSNGASEGSSSREFDSTSFDDSDIPF